MSRALHFGRREIDAIYVAAVVAIGVLVALFIGIASEMLEGETRGFDERLVLAFRAADPSRLAGPAWLTEVARDLTALGGGAVITIVVAAVSGFLFLTGKRHALVAILLATGGGIALSFLLKGHFARPRPELVPHLSIVSSSSFPSGHSMLAAVVYLTLAAMLVRLVERRTLKAYIAFVAGFVVLAVGVSRVLLGVHYPTDVAAGWAVGVAWSIACSGLMHYLQKKDVVEEPRETSGASTAVPTDVCAPVPSTMGHHEAQS